MKIIIPTCNAYLTAARAIIHSIKTYWPEHPPVILLGYDHPPYELPDGVRFHSIGVDETPQKWTTGLRSFIGSYDEETFILHMDDHIILRQVYDKTVKDIASIMDYDKSICKTFLDPQYIYSRKMVDEFAKITLNDTTIFEFPQYGPWRLSLVTAIWRKDYFFRYLENEMDPWKFEVQNNSAHNDGAKIMTVDRHLVMFDSLIKRGVKSGNWHNHAIKLYKSHTDNDGCEPLEDDFQVDPKFVKHINDIMDGKL